MRNGSLLRSLLVAEMLDGLRGRIEGRVALALQRSMASRFDGLIRELLVDAASLWESEGFFRKNDSEIACTVRMFDCASRLRDARAELALIHVQYDGPQPTPEMRRGLADPARARRPDLNFRVGEVVVHVEAKRLHLRDGLPRLYVDEGMRRFIDGHYPASPDGCGYMLAYVLNDPPPDAVAEVNAIISGAPDLGPKHVLGAPSERGPRLLLHVSLHNDGLRLLHQAIDIR